MVFINFIFFFLTLLVLFYLFFILFSKKRVPIFIEVFYIFLYSFILIFIIFPSLSSFLEELFGIENFVNFLVYISIFVAYFLIFILFRENEMLKAEISKLVREIALLELNSKKKNSKKKKIK